MDCTIAIVGNPNVGKTTLFNALTGLAHTTGNYPGVTVERRSGRVQLNGSQAALVDLPGTYSLAAHSPDEMIAVDVLLDQQEGEQPIDAILSVVDATNLERNLYLVSQLRELGKPLVVALNMTDLAAKQQIEINVPALEEALDARVVPICAYKRDGIDTLRAALVEAVAREPKRPNNGPDYPETLTGEVAELVDSLNGQREVLQREVPWVEAFRILVDRGGYAEQRVLDALPESAAGDLADRRTRAVERGSLAAAETRSRYAWIRGIVSDGVRRPETPPETGSDKLDRILTHKIFGTAAFALLMMIVFQSIYSWAGPVMDLVDTVFGGLGEQAEALIPEGALQSLVVDGLIAGVGSVLIFLPQIIILSLFIAILEDCGYMARAAFLMDKLLSRCGLSGQSFIPMLSSFACAIPGVMATRTIASRRDRLTTMLVAPLMSCSARLPVYLIMIGSFIPARKVMGGLIGLQGLTLFSMYVLGVAVAVPVAFILKKTLLKGATPPFLLELPSYKWPQPATVIRKVYGQGKEFVRRAGTIIFAVSVIVWALAYFPRSGEILSQYETQREEARAAVSDEAALEDALALIDHEESGALLRDSYFGRMGRGIEPIVKPLGWDWRIGMAAIASFPAREIIVATLGTIFNMGDEVDDASLALSEGEEETGMLRGILQSSTTESGAPLFNIPVALSIMVFFALCCQCAATLAVIKRETGTWRWPVFTFTYMTVLAYVASFVIYQATMAMGWAGV